MCGRMDALEGDVGRWVGEQWMRRLTVVGVHERAVPYPYLWRTGSDLRASEVPWRDRWLTEVGR